MICNGATLWIFIILLILVGIAIGEWKRGL
jgi:hypothetical protein